MEIEFLKIGTVSSIDPKNCTARVYFPDDDGLVSYDLPVLQRNAYRTKDYHSVNVGEDVVCAFLGSGTEEGFILGAVYTKGNPPPESAETKRTTIYADGTRVSYDMSSHTLTAQIDGTVITADRQNISVTAPQAVTINCTNATVKASGGVKIDTPATEVTGTLTVNGKITGKGGFAISGGGGGATATVSGGLQATGDITAGGISLQGHAHDCPHGGTTSPSK